MIQKEQIQNNNINNHNNKHNNNNNNNNNQYPSIAAIPRDILIKYIFPSHFNSFQIEYNTTHAFAPRPIKIDNPDNANNNDNDDTDSNNTNSNNNNNQYEPFAIISYEYDFIRCMNYAKHNFMQEYAFHNSTSINSRQLALANTLRCAPPSMVLLLWKIQQFNIQLIFQLLCQLQIVNGKTNQLSF
eukprot:UN09918